MDIVTDTLAIKTTSSILIILVATPNLVKQPEKRREKAK